MREISYLIVKSTRSDRNHWLVPAKTLLFIAVLCDKKAISYVEIQPITDTWLNYFAAHGSILFTREGDDRMFKMDLATQRTLLQTLVSLGTCKIHGRF